MARKIDINPIQAGGKVSLTDPTSALMKIGMMVIGFIIFFVALATGQNGAQKLIGTIAGLTGINLSGEESNGGLGLRGEL